MEDGAGGTSVGHGTLQYMAPENIRLQMLGDKDTKYALAADIYSIGESKRRGGRGRGGAERERERERDGGEGVQTLHLSLPS